MNKIKPEQVPDVVEKAMSETMLRGGVIFTPAPVGCICPPTSEQTCQNPVCPRKGVSTTAYSTSPEPKS